MKKNGMNRMKGAAFGCVLAIATLAMGGCAQGQSQMPYIGADAAKKQVLEQIGLEENQVTVSRMDMKTKNGMDYYQMDFSDANGNSYRYDIDALTGKVIESEAAMAESGGAAGTSAAAGETTAGGSTLAAAAGETAGANGAAAAAGQAAAETAGGSKAAAAGETTGGSKAAAAGETTGGSKAAVISAQAAGNGAAAPAAGGSGTMLTAEDAKARALARVGKAEGEVTFVRAKLDRDDGRQVYDVEFYGNDNAEYDVEVDAYSGAIVSVDQDMEHRRSSLAAAAGSGGAAQGTQAAGGQTAGTRAAAGQAAGTQAAQSSAAGSGAKLTAEDAKARALAHAGLAGDQVTFIKAQLDWDDGRQIYEVDFYGSDGTEYDYEIHADTGEVVKYDIEAPRRAAAQPAPQPTTAPPQPTAAPPSTTAAAGGSASVSAEQAKQMALAQVPGATAANIREFETDRENGRIEYEGTIVYGGMEYEFEIDAYSGAFRKWDSEREDD